jgi:hypothetical protein
VFARAWQHANASCRRLFWGRVPFHEFVQPGCTAKLAHPGCTAMTNRIQVCETLLLEGVEAYKKEGPKLMQRLVAKQKARTKDS